ncbi:MAG: DUF3644 domain-containing protein, partial [Bacteroidales bacterium]|nr:DUF3644 domain-containing protein [Bacteroidales bacterium]
WTYLLHAYYRSKKNEYRYFDQKKKRKSFHTTKHGAYKYWELEMCLNNKKSPIDSVTSSSLKFLIGLRHEIEHQMTTKIDDLLSTSFQACCLNYNHYLKKLFPKMEGIEKHLPFSLQFSSLYEKQIEQLIDYEELPQNIATYIQNFNQALSEKDFIDSRFSYRVLFVPKTANRKGQADRVIEFISPDSNVPEDTNKERIVIKEREKQKYLPSQIVEQMKSYGYDLISRRFYNHEA